MAIDVASSVDLRWPAPRQVVGVALYPGYGKSRALFFANARVKAARLTFSDGHVVDVRFDDTPSLQEVELSDGWATPVASVRIEILEVYPGEKYEDACISELRVY